jgi:hypothetical protein
MVRSMTEQTASLPAEPPPAPPLAEPKVRRTLGVPVVGAIGGAALVIGLLAGGIIGYAVHSDGPDNGSGRQGGPGQRFQQGGPGNGQLPPQPNGQSQQQDGSAG